MHLQAGIGDAVARRERLLLFAPLDRWTISLDRPSVTTMQNIDQKITQDNFQVHTQIRPLLLLRLYHNVLYDTSIGDLKMYLQHAGLRHCLTPE